MHEMAICSALLRQVEKEARKHNATGIEKITISVGVLSGVDKTLIEQAFSVAKAGTIAANAELSCQTKEVRVECTICKAESLAPPNRLSCSACGEWRTKIISGDGLMLEQIIFSVSNPESPHKP